eukprot:10539452-Karenia_brevis.AAC.1
MCIRDRLYNLVVRRAGGGSRESPAIKFFSCKVEGHSDVQSNMQQAWQTRGGECRKLCDFVAE